MVFSSVIFMFAFLPLVLLAYFAARSINSRNMVLLAASLAFYAWGEQVLVLLLVCSIVVNHLLGRMIERARRSGGARPALVLAVGANLLLLGLFKYANFLVDNLNVGLQAIGVPGVTLEPIHLPLGISFFTFQAITYVVDIYRGEARAQGNAFHTALYISMFPQLVAGPIVRYRTIAARLTRRYVTREGFAIGLRRFIIGLGKKVLIANTLAVPADAIFALEGGDLGTPLAWLGVACYTFQIYFDFSGYSDMAIGLGRMFGFKFPENFRYPYISASIREFWTRWHISLSTWFRDYLYIPLGGGRVSPWRVQLNLVTVFVLCGLWHGASWTFLVWGLFHGVFLAAERTGFGRWLEAAGRPLGHAYCLLVVMVGWVFFRAESLPEALDYLAALSGLGPRAGPEHHLLIYLTPDVALALAVAALGATPVVPRVERWTRGALARAQGRPAVLWRGAVGVTDAALLGLVLVVSATDLVAGSYNPFIYFRF
jgi:alginate O-acetyltransferase complex protein AlgI